MKTGTCVSFFAPRKERPKQVDNIFYRRTLLWYTVRSFHEVNMPLYEYKCSKCGTVFEFFQKVTDPSPKKCPRCQGPLKKILSPPALQFKGSGWYVTDYAAKGGQPSASDNDAKPKKDKEPSKEKSSDSASKK